GCASSPPRRQNTFGSCATDLRLVRYSYFHTYATLLASARVPLLFQQEPDTTRHLCREAVYACEASSMRASIAAPGPLPWLASSRALMPANATHQPTSRPASMLVATASRSMRAAIVS